MTLLAVKMYAPKRKGVHVCICVPNTGVTHVSCGETVVMYTVRTKTKVRTCIRFCVCARTRVYVSAFVRACKRACVQACVFVRERDTQTPCVFVSACSHMCV